MSLKVNLGDPMPSVGLRATDGYLLNLRSFVGKQPSLVLFFGAPSLSGAARERGDSLVDAFVEGAKRLSAAGVGVMAVTTDSEAQQNAYVEERTLPFLLLSDERRSAVETLGVATVKDGRNVNAQPTAFAVGVDGTILDIVEDASPRGLIARLLDAFREPDASEAPTPAVSA